MRNAEGSTWSHRGVEREPGDAVAPVSSNSASIEAVF